MAVVLKSTAFWDRPLPSVQQYRVIRSDKRSSQVLTRLT
jgi:hypothetical protein